MEETRKEDMTKMEEPKKDVVLITGAAGCLGQHIVKLLQEQDDNVGEIRVYDFRKYVNTLGHPEEKTMVRYLEDIRSPTKLLEAMEGVDCVIHLAALTDLRMYADDQRMESVNVDGTQRVINACLEKNVSRLIIASTTAVVCGTEHIFYGTESTTPTPTTFMIGKYAETKYQAELLVLRANGQLCSDGETVLQTVALRPTPFFGENDRNFVYHFLKYTKRTHQTYYRVKSLDERLQISYVGNVAWAFVKAKEKLAVDESIAGEAFFITDDTPIIDVHEHIRPFIEAHGYRVSSVVVPYWLAWFLLQLFCFIIKLINIFYRYDEVETPTIKMLNYTCSTFFFNRSKATLRLDYQPIYDSTDAKWQSYAYYTAVTVI